MKRKITAILLTFALICGLFSVPVFALGISESPVTPTYWSFDGENLTLQPSFDENTSLIFVNGEEGETYTLPDSFYHKVYVITNNVAVTIPDTDKIETVLISGTGSIIRNNLTITNANTSEFTGNANNGNEIIEFYSGNDDFYCFTYSGDTTLSFSSLFGAATDYGLYQVNVDGNLTIDCILNAIEVNVTGDLFIKAPVEGDPNGLNLRTTGYKNGSLTVGGTFTADDGQMFLVDEGAAVSENIKLYYDDNGVDSEYDIDAEHFTKEFSYDALKSKFMFRGISGGEENLNDFDCRVHYSQDKSCLSIVRAESEEDLFDGERTTFNISTEPESPSIGKISFKIDLTVDCFENAIPAEDRIQTPSISILKITYPRDAEPVEEWVVRSGASTDADYTFANNTLSFTPESEAPFELIVCLDKNEYDFVTFSAPEGKILVEYTVFGNGTVAIEDFEDGIFCRNRAKAVLPDSAENIIFTVTTEDRFEEFSVDGRYYSVEYLPCDGISYNSETGKLSIPLASEQNHYYIDFNILGDQPVMPSEFQVVYNPDKFDVICTSDTGSFELFDHARCDYPEDMTNPPYITVTPKDGHTFKGMLVFTNSGEDYYVNALEDGNKFTFVNTDINCVQLIADDEPGINNYTVRYNKDIAQVSKNGSILTPDKVYYFFSNGELTFGTYEVDPYRVLVRTGADQTEDITYLYSNGYLNYTPDNDFPRTFEFYFTKAEYDCATMNPDPEHNIVELMTHGGGNIEILSTNGEPISDDCVAKYENRYRIALNNEDTNLSIKLNPFNGQSVESVRIDGEEQTADSYTGNILNINVAQNKGFVNGEIVFSNASTEKSGVFGDNLFWEYDEGSKTLTVKGNGKIPDLQSSGRPWENFKYTTSHIVIEEGVTGIGSNAFHYMTGAESVSIPSTVLSINEFAFLGLSKLKTLNIPEGVITIDRQAFQSLSSLEKLTIPSTLRKFTLTTFEGVAKLENITVATENPIFHSAGNCLINTAQKEIVLGSTKAVIPTDGSVTSIGAYSFYGSSIKNITIPKQITTIGNHAFTYSGLTEIVIPDGITTLSNNAFRLCTSLETVYIPSSVKSIEYYCFGDCNKLDSIYFCGTEDEWNTITVAEGNEPLGNVTVTYHKESEEYTSDATNHWKVCEICGEVLGKEKHTFVNGACSVCGQKPPKVNFPDVNYNDWYGPSVEYAVAAGLIKGYSNGRFGTADGIQRQDFVIILSRLSGDDLSVYEGKKSFKDVDPNAYYATALAWAKDKGVSNGYQDGSFGVGRKVTREQIMTFLHNYAKLKGCNVTVTDAEKAQIRAQYSDFVNVSSYAQEATYWALKNGVISGKQVNGKRYISPVSSAQRCEVAAMFYNIDQKGIFAK